MRAVVSRCAFRPRAVAAPVCATAAQRACAHITPSVLALDRVELRVAANAFDTSRLSVAAVAGSKTLAAFEVPAGWAADHDSASFQQLTFQRSDPVPSCGGRVVAGVRPADGGFLVELTSSATAVTFPSATTTWAGTPMEAFVPTAALLASALSCASDLESRELLSAALESASADSFAERQSKGYTTYYARLQARAAHTAAHGGNTATMSDALYEGLSALKGTDAPNAPPSQTPEEARATPVHKCGSYARPSAAASAEQAANGGGRCTRGELLERLSRDGYVVIRDAALRNGADASLTDAAAAALPLGAEYQARAAPATCPDELLASRVTAMTALAASTFGVVRHTHYGAVSTWGDSRIGEESSSAPAVPSPDNNGAGGAEPAHLDTAYVRVGIGLHTDSTYFAEPPGIQIFGCVHRVPGRSTGGASEMADGFAAAWDLYEEDKELFRALARTPVPAVYMKEGRAFTAHRPVLSMRCFGGGTEASYTAAPDGVVHVSFNPYDRAPMPASVAAALSPLELERFYVGYTRFAQLCAARAQRFQLDVGDVLFFNNLRMLHVRRLRRGGRRCVRHRRRGDAARG